MWCISTLTLTLILTLTLLYSTIQYNTIHYNTIKYNTTIQCNNRAGAALDVLEVEPPTSDSEELRMHPNVVISPHQGASTYDAQLRVAHDVARNMSDIFDGGAYVGVVNAPDLGAIKAGGYDMIKFVELSESFGAILSQRAFDKKLKSINVNIAGSSVADTNTLNVIKSAVLKGCLTAYTNEHISMVNALAIADSLGLHVSASVSKETSPETGFTNEISVEFRYSDDSKLSIEGTVLAGAGMRITRVDGYTLGCPPGEYMIFFENQDHPGVLHRVSDILGTAGINIDNFSLGREAHNSMALGALVIDRPCSDLVMRKLRALKDFKSVHQVDLPINMADENHDKPIGRPTNPGRCGVVCCCVVVLLCCVVL
jgi:D-3-phosphoglycerate dehydrogenase / 2-oxoglutarate reductase